MEKLINRSKKFSWKDLAKKELNIIIRGKKWEKIFLDIMLIF
jgi:hypothetical protein